MLQAKRLTVLFLILLIPLNISGLVIHEGFHVLVGILEPNVYITEFHVLDDESFRLGCLGFVKFRVYAQRPLSWLFENQEMFAVLIYPIIINLIYILLVSKSLEK